MKKKIAAHTLGCKVNQYDTEAMLDFPDDELPQTVPAELAERLQALLAALRRLLATAPAGHRLRDGRSRQRRLHISPRDAEHDPRRRFR